jgi:hypothetical protein
MPTSATTIKLLKNIKDEIRCFTEKAEFFNEAQKLRQTLFPSVATSHLFAAAALYV